MDNKIIVKIRGGLGNQIFQYAFAKYLGNKLNVSKIIIDTSYFAKKHIRGKELDKLSIKECEWSENGSLFFDLTYFLYRCLDRLSHHKQIFHFPKYVFNTGLFFCDKVIEINQIPPISRAFVAGYFQQEKIIRNVANELKEIIVPKIPLSKAASDYHGLICEGTCIAISIRAGDDYLKFGWPMCSKEYYREGLKKLVKRFPSSKIFVFSDCISKVKDEEWFKEWNVEYIVNCSSTESLYLLSQCSNYVIANSTFSWLGAYLSANKDRVIIAPRYFYKDIEMKSGGLHIPGCIYQDNQSGKET